MSTDPDARTALLRRGLRLEYATLGWNIVGIVITLAAAVAARSVALAGFALEDAGGRAVLPEGDLAPRAFALVVSEAYVADDGVDPPPAPGTLMLRVPSLGRSGLSNEGEKLTLRDAAGTALSAFPAVKTKNGVSIARIAPDAPDDDPTAFLPSPNASATPGAPNFSPP